MTTLNETFGRLLRGAINSIAAYEGKAAAAVEEELGTAIGLSGATIQRYKNGSLPPEPRPPFVPASLAAPGCSASSRRRATPLLTRCWRSSPMRSGQPVLRATQR